MILRTDTLSKADLYGILRQKQDEGMIGYDIEIRVEDRRSRTHNRAFEIDLFTTSPTQKRRPSASQRTPNGAKGATWDEWGWFLAGVYSDDEGVQAGPYLNIDNFNVKTDYRFA